MTKKIIAAVLVVILMLAGCSGNNDTEVQNPPVENNDLAEVIVPEVTGDDLEESEFVKENNESEVKVELTPELELSAESVPAEPEKEVSIETKPEKDEKKEPPKETSQNYIYPPGTSTKGLSERDIKQGVYYEVATGIKYDQDGNVRGKYAGAIYDDLITNEKDDQAISDANDKLGDKIYDGTGEGSDTSNFNSSETAGKFTYPPGTSTKGLSERDIKQGVYYEIATGNKYDQEGNFRGKYAGAIYDDLTMSDEEAQAALEKNLENAEKIYDGTGEGSDTSNFN